MIPNFSQNLILQKAFETIAPLNEELKEWNSIEHFAEKFKLLVDRFSSFSRLRQAIGRENDQSKEKQGSPCVRDR